MQSQRSIFPFQAIFFTDSIMEDLATNTNKYAEIQRNHFISQYLEKRQRSWKPCTAADIRILFGLWIYMGINKLPSGRDQWYRDVNRYMTRYRKSRYKLWEHPRHREGLRDPDFLNRQSMRDLVRGSIGVVRFEQLKRYFQVSDPTLEKPDDRDWFHRVGPLSSKLRNAFQKILSTR